MLLTLTDHLTCPRCGPAAGLILLLEEADDRRVRHGALGCPRCRTRYPVAGRVADLREAAAEEERERGPGRGQEGAGAAAGAAAALAVRVGGLLGLDEGHGFVLMDGPLGLDVAFELAALVPDCEMVVPIGEARCAEAAELDLSALLETGALPIASRTMRAVAHLGAAPVEGRLLELIRVCRPTGRLLVELGAGGDARDSSLDRLGELLEGAGAQVRARDASALMAVVL